MPVTAHPTTASSLGIHCPTSAAIDAGIIAGKTALAAIIAGEGAGIQGLPIIGRGYKQLWQDPSGQLAKVPVPGSSYTLFTIPSQCLSHAQAAAIAGLFSQANTEQQNISNPPSITATILRVAAGAAGVVFIVFGIFLMTKNASIQDAARLFGQQLGRVRGQ